MSAKLSKARIHCKRPVLNIPSDVLRDVGWTNETRVSVDAAYRRGSMAPERIDVQRSEEGIKLWRVSRGTAVPLPKDHSGVDQNYYKVVRSGEGLAFEHVAV